MFGLKPHEKLKIQKELVNMISKEATKINAVLGRTSGTKKVEVTLKKKLLILDYLGVFKNLDIDNTKRAKLLSLLLNQSEQNIREYFSDKNIREKEIKTKENLTFVLDLFNDLKLDEYKSQIMKDIDKFVEKE